MRRALQLILVAFSVFVFSSCTQDEPRPEAGRNERNRSLTSQPEVVESSSPSSSVEIAPDAGRAVLYLNGKVLRRFEVESEKSRRIGRLSSVDATASQDGALVAYVTSSNPAAEDEDFVTSPELHLYEVASADDTTVGPGFSPLWNTSGDSIAYLEPQETRVCEGEGCAGKTAVVIAGVSTEQRTTLSEAGDWTLLDWLGDRVLVSDQSGELNSFAPSESGEPEPLSIPTSEFWGSSHDGKWIVRVSNSGTTFQSPSAPKTNEEIDLDGAILGEGSWSPDSKRVAAVLLEDGGSTSLVLLSPGDPEAEMLEGSQGASGPVLWAADGSSFVYARATGKGGLDLEAVLCDFKQDERPSCGSLFSWPRGVTLLALT